MTALGTLSQDELLLLLPRLRRYARVLTADLRRADELVLDTLARASATRDPPAQPPHPGYWLFGVMHRLYGERSFLQEPRKRAPSLITERRAEGARALPPPAPSDRAAADNMQARLSRLPVEQREVLVLVVLEGLPYAEIATLLGVELGTVLSRLRRAREALRSTSAESGPTDG
jgi:RNA polymerase sigma-70 factor, ECF subfamily